MQYPTQQLRTWEELAQAPWPTLLIGNGLSINVWHRFSYASLYDAAQLSQQAKTIFDTLDTTTFEGVLEALMHAEIVLDAMKADEPEVANLYHHVRDVLFETVGRVHVQWNSVPDTTLDAISLAIARHEHTFTTNYDLLPYWALMREPSGRIVDLFLGGNGHVFEPGSTEVFAGRTGLYYLHGGVHLWQDDLTGRTGKWVNNGQGLLEQLKTVYTSAPSRRPLFVSEGSAQRKQRTIRRSDYLSFALSRLREDAGNTVIFGHSLSSSDEHIADALRAGPTRIFAVAIKPRSRGSDQAQMGGLRS